MFQAVEDGDKKASRRCKLVVWKIMESKGAELETMARSRQVSNDSLSAYGRVVTYGLAFYMGGSYVV